jgi:hypothetical protein
MILGQHDENTLAQFEERLSPIVVCMAEGGR